MWRQIIDANWRIPYVGGWCEGFVEGAWGQSSLPTIDNQTTSGVWGSAMDKWNANPGNGNHPWELPPIGRTVPVYFSLGSTGYGHTAICLDDGMIASSTQGGFHRQGYIHPNLQSMIDMYAQYNNGCTYLGWSEYVGNVRVVEWVKPVVDTPAPDPIVIPEPIVEPPVEVVVETPIVVPEPVASEPVIDTELIDDSQPISEPTTPIIADTTLVEKPIVEESTKLMSIGYNMKEFLNSLLSRKFLLTLGAVITFIAMKQYDQALISVLAYLGVNVAQKATTK